MSDVSDGVQRGRFRCMRCRHQWVSLLGGLGDRYFCPECGSRDEFHLVFLHAWAPQCHPSLAAGFTHVSAELTARLNWFGLLPPEGMPKGRWRCGCGGLIVDGMTGEDLRAKLRKAERSGTAYCPF